jgi:hypothetical protein
MAHSYLIKVIHLESFHRCPHAHCPLRERVNLLASRQEDQFRTLQTSMIAKLTEAIRDQVSSLPRWPQSLEETQQKLRSEAISARISRYKQPEKSALRNAKSTGPSQPASDQDSFADEYAQEYAAKLAEMEEDQWESLSFPVMCDREDQIADAELRTFDWILENPGSKDRPWSNFLEWLEKGKGLYWINGKAGSGKSTLMKYLNSHHRVSDTLQAWSGETPLITASFFFWYNGNDLQKTQVGLFRALLYQSLRNHRELIPIVLSEAADVAPTNLSHYWTLPRLKSAFTKLIEQKEVPLKIYLLVDGLDEYVGDYLDIAQLFRYLSNFEDIKLCVSSRPLLTFDRAFKDFPGLVLQNLTFGDIQTYVQNRLGANERFRELEMEEPALGPKLAFEVVSKAFGVFLWVKLVVHSLLEGLSNYDRSVDLERRLSELPEDLDGLYWHILDRVKPVWYLEEGFKLLLLVYAAVVPLNLLQLAFADIAEPNLAINSRIDEMPLERQQTLCKGMAGRIKSRCLGLLEVTDMAYTDEKYRRVQFLHKSVRDFIDTPRMRNRIKECLAGKDVFVPEIAIMKSLLIQLKTVRSRLSKEQSYPEGGITREAWFDEVRPIVFEIVRYGQITNSRHPGISYVYSSLVTKVDDVASDLWHSVSFRAPEEIRGEVHWSVAPRKPGATLRVALDRIHIQEKLTTDSADIAYTTPSQTNTDDDELDSKQLRVSDTDTSSAPITFRSSSRSITALRVRFADLPTPQCFPGGDNEIERPQRSWPCDKTQDSPFRLPIAEFSKANRGFEAFVRAFGLDQYADERFKSAVNPEKPNNQTEIHTQPEKKSFWSRLNLIKKRPR